MNITETPRLLLRTLTLTDAPFIVQLVNEPAWLRFIGDKGVRTVADAEQYLLNGPLKSYGINGFGLWMVVLKETGESIGMCGLIRRDTLPDVDMGFAYLTAHHGKGYGYEAAAATLDHAWHVLHLNRVVAIASPDNGPSIALLSKLGFLHETPIIMPGEGEPVVYMAINRQNNKP